MSALHHGFEKKNGRQCTIMIDRNDKTGVYYVATALLSKKDNFSRKKGRSICAIRMDTLQNTAKTVRGSYRFLREQDVVTYLTTYFEYNSAKSTVDFVESFIRELDRPYNKKTML